MIYKKLVKISVSLLGISLLIGCQNVNSNNHKKQTKAQATPTSISAPQKSILLSSEEREINMYRCKQQLEAMKMFDYKNYRQKKKMFDDLVMNADNYSRIRDTISPQSRAVMDNLYLYKTARLCSDIQHAVTQDYSIKIEKLF